MEGGREGGTANNGMMSPPPPPPGLISDSLNIVHSAIKVHCAGGGGARIDRNAAESEEEIKRKVGSDFDC